MISKVLKKGFCLPGSKFHMPVVFLAPGCDKGREVHCGKLWDQSLCWLFWYNWKHPVHHGRIYPWESAV